MWTTLLCSYSFNNTSLYAMTMNPLIYPKPLQQLPAWWLLLQLPVTLRLPQQRPYLWWMSTITLMFYLQPIVPPPPFLLSASGSAGKCTHLVMTLGSQDPQSAFTGITTPSTNADPVLKKQAKHSDLSQKSHSSRHESSHAPASGKIMWALAMVGMQSQISWLTDIFEKLMSTPDDGIAAKRSLAISQIWEFEDGLTVQQNAKMILKFQKDASVAQTYLDLLNREVCQAWLQAELDDWLLVPHPSSTYSLFWSGMDPFFFVKLPTCCCTCYCCCTSFSYCCNVDKNIVYLHFIDYKSLLSSELASMHQQRQSISLIVDYWWPVKFNLRHVWHYRQTQLFTILYQIAANSSHPNRL